MPTPHKHAELIKKWAEDTTLEFEVRVPRAGRLDTVWEDLCGVSPIWNPDLEYRIKPKLVKREGWLGIKKPDAYPFSVNRITTNIYSTREVVESCGNYLAIKVEWEEEV